MKLEKRGGEIPPQAGGSPQENPDGGGKKPVIIYILILFIVAFFLMALSLLMHQRNNAEAIGQLRESIAAMKDAQLAEERAADLENQLAKFQEACTQAELRAQAANDAQNNTAHTLERTQEAMEWFWQLDEAFLQGVTDMCRIILETMNQNAASPMSDYFPQDSKTAERYQEILESLEEQEGGAVP